MCINIWERIDILCQPAVVTVGAVSVKPQKSGSYIDISVQMIPGNPL